MMLWTALPRLACRTGLFALTALVVIAATDVRAGSTFNVPTHANSSLPAISAINGKFEGLGGEFAHDTLGAVAGSLSVPLSHRYGLQIDGLAGSWAEDGVFGVGAHLFWRDPRAGMVGLYGDHLYWDGLGGQAVSRVGAEAEWYAGRFSLEGLAGAEFGELKDRAFSRVNLAFYPRDDLRLSVGHRYLGGDHALTLGAEWQVAPSGVALFAEGLVGENRSDAILAGIRIYVAPEPKSLMRRHREDDPPNEIKGALQSLAANLPAGTVAPVKPPTCPSPQILVSGVCLFP